MSFLTIRPQGPHCRLKIPHLKPAIGVLDTAMLLGYFSVRKKMVLNFSIPGGGSCLKGKWLITHLHVKGGLDHGFDNRSHEYRTQENSL